MPTKGSPGMVADGIEAGGGLLALAIAAGGGVAWLLQWWDKRRTAKRSQQLEDEKRDDERRDEAYERIKSDRDDARKREEQCQAALIFLRSQTVEVQLRVRQMGERIEYLEELLDRSNVPHRKWVDRELGTSPGSPESQPPDPEPDHDHA